MGHRKKIGKPSLPGNRARQLREARGIPIEKAALDLGVDHSTLSKVERKPGLSFDWLQRLTKYYHVNPTELIDIQSPIHGNLTSVTENAQGGDDKKEEIVDHVVGLIEDMMREYTAEVVRAAFFRAMKPEQRKDRASRP